MEISRKSQESNLETSIASQADSLARISVSVDLDAVLSPAREAGCGQNTLVSLGKFDHDSYSLRTSQACLTTPLCAEFSETFPSLGLMLNGEVFEQPNSAHGMSGLEFSWWPTPQASDNRFALSSFGSTLRNPLRNPGIGKTHWCHPEFSEWLMGFPLGWTDLKPAETVLSPKSPSGSDAE